MAIEIEKPEMHIPDANAKVRGSCENFEKGHDSLYVSGEGFYLSNHKLRDFERKKEKIQPNDKDYKILIDENTILEYAKSIKKTAEMKSHREKYAERCHPGTDTENPETSEFHWQNKSNEFRLDHSQSTILLTTPSGKRFLNGSSVEHSSYVNIKIISPDGRMVCEVAMTFDQFASFLVTNSSTPCTLDAYWDIDKNSIMLQEVVKEPNTISNRMEQHLDNRLSEMEERLNKIQTTLDEQIATGKAMSKTKLQEIQNELTVYKSHFKSNRDFTIQQAKEELASITEQAAIAIAWNHKLNPKLVENEILKLEKK